MELNEYILAKAIENNICQPWANKISVTKDPDELLKMYVTGIDFCLEHDFPSNTDLKQLAGGIINQYGIYIDQVAKLQDRPFVVLLGESEASLSLTGYNVAQLFAKGTSRAAVRAADNSYLVIDCFDDTVITLTAANSAKVLINIYGNAKVSSEASPTANIRVVEKLQKDY